MVQTGLEILEKENFKAITNKSLGLLINHTSINSKGEHILSLLKRHKNVKITALLSAEHGVSGTLQDGENLNNENLPNVFPLFDENFNFKSNLNLFKSLDTILVDLQDIGTRFYTFPQTLAYLMETAKIHGIKIIVLDRPNPISGNKIEGNGIIEGYESLIGWGPIPQRHGLTLGELAKLFNQGLEYKPKIGCDLEVIEVKNWNRENYFDEIKLPWILPSPNIPTLDSAICYSATCMLEATEFSEGRGTQLPFQQFGAPDFNFKKFISSLNNYKEFYGTGFLLFETSFIPIFNKFKNELCKGCKINITDRKLFRPVNLGIAIMLSLGQTHQKYLTKIINSPINEIQRLDKFYGSNKLRLGILEKINPKELFNSTHQQSQSQY